jgi:hypothetical protein
MYLKRSRRWRSSREIVYVTLAHNVYEPRADGKKQTRPLEILALGPEHELDPVYLEDIVASAQALFDRRVEKGMSPVEAAYDVAKHFQPHRGAVRILSSRKLGLRLLLAPVWEDLGLKAAFEEFATAHQVRAFDFERLVFGLVLNRIVDPKSKRAANEWLQQDAYFPEAEGWEVQHYYRALDFLHEHWEELEKRMFEALWAVSSEEDRLFWLIDTTSSYFESTLDDQEKLELENDWQAFEEGERDRPPHRPRPQVVNEPALRMRGHSKDGHPGDPQVVVASICLRNGLVLGHEVYAGNTNDKTIAKDLMETMPNPCAGTVRMWVSDGGMMSRGLQETLDEGGWFRLSAESIRRNTFARERILSLTGRYQAHPTKPQYSFRTVEVDAEESPRGRAETWVVVRNSWERERRLKKIAKHVAQVKEALSRKEPEGSHSKAMCEVATHATLKRYVKKSDKVPGRYVLDQEAIRLEEQLAGTHLLRTTLTELSGAEVFEGYQLLQVVERNHREYKGPLKLRPMYHRADQRIRAHVMLMILAANCVRVLEMRTGESIDDLRKRFERIHAHQVTEYGRPQWQCSELSKEDQVTLEKAGCGPIPESWQAWRDTIQSSKRQAS